MKVSFKLIEIAQIACSSLKHLKVVALYRPFDEEAIHPTQLTEMGLTG
jgi:hypothetical protein